MPDINTTNPKGDVNAAATLGMQAMMFNPLVNVLTQLFSGVNFNPAQHGTLGTIGYLASQTNIAQMLGIDNPAHHISTVREITGALYGYNNNPEQAAHQIRISQALNNFERYIKNQGDSNIYATDRMTRASIAKYLVENGDIRDMADMGRFASSSTMEMDAAEQAIKITQKIVKLGKNVKDQMDLVKSIGGTNDFDQAADTYIKYIQGLVQSGMSLAERQATITNTIRMTEALRSQGLSYTHAASISRMAVGGAFMGARVARQAGIENYDNVTAANNLAAIQLEAENTAEGQSKLVAARTIQESDTLSDDQKKALITQVKNSTPEQIASLMKQNGLSAAFDAGMRLSRINPAWLRNTTDKETTEVMEDMAMHVGQTFNNKQIEKFFNHNVREIGKSPEDLAAAKIVREAMASGDWSKVTNRVWDKASKYITQEGRDVVIAQRSALRARQEKFLNEGLENVQGMISEGSQWKPEMMALSLDEMLQEEGLTGVKMEKVDADEISQILAFGEMTGQIGSNTFANPEEYTKFEGDMASQIKAIRERIKKSKVKGPVVAKVGEGYLQFDEQGNITGKLSKEEYEKARDKKTRESLEKDPMGSTLLKIFDLLKEVTEKFLNNPKFANA